MTSAEKHRERAREVLAAADACDHSSCGYERDTPCLREHIARGLARVEAETLDEHR